jgi:phage terminase small subunit
MNRLISPKQQPTSLDRPQLQKWLDEGCKGVHESVVRSYQVLQLVKDLLEKKTDHEVILQIIELNYDEQS